MPALLDLLRPSEVFVGLNESPKEGAESSVANILPQSKIHSLNMSNSLSFQGGMGLLNLGSCSENLFFYPDPDKLGAL